MNLFQPMIPAPFQGSLLERRGEAPQTVCNNIAVPVGYLTSQREEIERSNATLNNHEGRV